MILASHAIAGAAIGRFANNPLLAFFLGYGSHLVLDAIPHWQYKLRSKTYSADGKKEDIVIGKKFFKDLIVLGIDFFSGVFLSLLVFDGGQFFHPSFSILAGIAGGVMPDVLQFVYFKYRHEPLVSLQKLHNWAHASWNFAYDSKLGMALQTAIVASIAVVSRITLR